MADNAASTPETSGKPENAGDDSNYAQATWPKGADLDDGRATDWRIVVNGQPVMLPVAPESRFRPILVAALEAVASHGYAFSHHPEGDWEIRDRRGRLLYNGDGRGFATVGELQERGDIADATLWINLKPGVGA